jgi:hypothetical protein
MLNVHSILSTTVVEKESLGFMESRQEIYD